eukprot:SAG11_NODE_48_length_20030_cov_232.459084_2_plen_227_part_00
MFAGQALLICAEMLGFAIAHRQVFAATDFLPDHREGARSAAQTSWKRAVQDMFDNSDLARGQLSALHAVLRCAALWAVPLCRAVPCYAPCRLLFGFAYDILVAIYTDTMKALASIRHLVLRCNTSRRCNAAANHLVAEQITDISSPVIAGVGAGVSVMGAGVTAGVTGVGKGIVGAGKLGIGVARIVQNNRIVQNFFSSSEHTSPTTLPTAAAGAERMSGGCDGAE